MSKLWRLAYMPNIPFVDRAFTNDRFICEPVYQVDEQTLKPYDILLCRSTSPINQSTLGNNQLKIVATATSGIEHLDFDYLNKNNIAVFSAPGANAPAVRDYILSVLAYLEVNPTSSTVGIIGVGHVGSLIDKQLRLLGFQTYLNDPLRAQAEPDFIHHELETISRCDIVSLHVPLTKSGPYPTVNLINANFLNKMKNNSVLINCARGEVCDEDALLDASARLQICLDVYQNEPNINANLVSQATIATPHIAGHAIESKIRATYWLRNQIYQYLQLAIPNDCLVPTVDVVAIENLKQSLAIYSPDKESQALKRVSNAQNFIKLRKHHQYRHESNVSRIK